MRLNKKRRYGRWTLALILGLVALLFVLPMILTVVNSFLSEEEISRSYGTALGDPTATYMEEKVVLKFIPDWVSGSQYVTVLLQSKVFLMKFWNSVLYAVPITLLQVSVAAMAAYGFTRYRTRGRGVVFFLYIVLTIMPYQVTLVPNYLVSRWMGIFDTPWAILLPGIFAPFGVYLLTTFMRRIPKEYMEAAQLDGAGEWCIFFKICLPQCKSALMAVGMLIFFDYWNMVEQPLVLLRDDGLQPLSVYLSNINQEEVGVAFAAAVVYLIPSLLLFLHGERHLEEGIVTGGMK